MPQTASTMTTTNASVLQSTLKALLQHPICRLVATVFLLKKVLFQALKVQWTAQAKPKSDAHLSTAITMTTTTVILILSRLIVLVKAATAEALKKLTVQHSI